jgi:hypothetical protein
MTGGRCRGEGGIWATQPRSLGRRRGVRATQEQKMWRAPRQRKKEEGDKNKTAKKKIQRSGKKKNRTMSSERIDLVAFPEGLRARPLDQRKFLIRSTWRNTVRQSSYIPSVLKIVLDVLAKIYVVQIVLLYYPRSTNPRCALSCSSSLLVLFLSFNANPPPEPPPLQYFSQKACSPGE